MGVFLQKRCFSLSFLAFLFCKMGVLCLKINFAAKGIIISSTEWNYSLFVVDPGFPRGGALTPEGGAPTYIFGQFFPKTAWKWRNFGPEGGARGTRPPLDLSLVVSHKINLIIVPFFFVAKYKFLREYGITVRCYSRREERLSSRRILRILNVNVV